jgi:DNA-binding transcriptional LysR family regulator
VLPLDPRHLATLETVVRTGSFAAAAEALGYTRPAVSQQIAELERRTGLRVLERRPVRPTPAGLVLLDAAMGVRAALATAAQELDAVRGGRTGQLRLGAFASAAGNIVPPALARLAAAHPGVQVSISQLEADASYSQLLRGDLDLALTFDYDVVPLPPPALLRRTLVADDPVLAVLPGGHPLAAQPVVDLADLACEAWIAAPRAGVPLELLAQLARSAGFRARLWFGGDDVRTVAGLVAAGLGVALLPRLALRHSPAGVLVRPLAGAPLTRFLYTTRLDTRHAPPVVTALETLLAAVAAEPDPGH